AGRGAGLRAHAGRGVPRRDGAHARTRRRRGAGGAGVTRVLVLTQRSVREALRTPEGLVPTLCIPLFFVVVNVGQAARIFPSGATPFLMGQNYAAFQLPSSILLAASFWRAALYLVEDIEGGYFDKLRASPVARTAIIFGRLTSEAVKSVCITTV